MSDQILNQDELQQASGPRRHASQRRSSERVQVSAYDEKPLPRANADLLYGASVPQRGRVSSASRRGPHSVYSDTVRGSSYRVGSYRGPSSPYGGGPSRSTSSGKIVVCALAILIIAAALYMLVPKFLG